MSLSIQMLNCITLYHVVLHFASVDEILKCDHSNKAIERYFPVVLFIMQYKLKRFYLLNLWMKSKSVTIQMKVTEQYFLWCYTIMLHN